MAKLHVFAESLTEGERAERELDRYFSDRWSIQPVSRAAQRKGMDRVFTERRMPGRVVRVEYKADSKAAETGNAFVETISVDTAGKSGWAYTSQADVLIYFIPPQLTLYIIEFPALRKRLPDWVRAYPLGRALNEGYFTHGRLVPLREFERIAVEVVSL